MEEHEELIEIKIDFERGFGDLARIFRAMTGLIESTQLIDNHISAAISTTVRTVLILQDIEASSLKAKHKILDWCSERNDIKNRDEVNQLESEIYILAQESDVKLLPAYAHIEIGILLTDISIIRYALENLESKDSASYKSPEGTSVYNPSLTISDELVKELLIRETITSEGEKIIKVKKPDYLGMSKWVFKYAEHMIEAKILDNSWLNQFQNKQISVQPGDSLRVLLREEASYGYNNEIVNINYEIIEVQEVITSVKYIQGSLLK